MLKQGNSLACIRHTGDAAVGSRLQNSLTCMRAAQVLQMAMGHGFKAAACVWQARKTNATQHPAWGLAPPYKQVAKEDAAQAAGELLATRDLTPAARAQAAEYLAAVAAMEHGTAAAPAACGQKEKEEEEEEGIHDTAGLVNGAASAHVPNGAAPAPPRRHRPTNGERGRC